MEGDYGDTPTTISSFNQNELRNDMIKYYVWKFTPVSNYKYL